MIEVLRKIGTFAICFEDMTGHFYYHDTRFVGRNLVRLPHNLVTKAGRLSRPCKGTGNRSRARRVLRSLRAHYNAQVLPQYRD